MVNGSTKTFFIDLTIFIDMPSKPQLDLDFMLSIIFMTCSLSMFMNLSFKQKLCFRKSVKVFCPLLANLLASFLAILTKNSLKVFAISNFSVIFRPF